MKISCPNQAVPLLGNTSHDRKTLKRNFFAENTKKKLNHIENKPNIIRKASTIFDLVKLIQLCTEVLGY